MACNYEKSARCWRHFCRTALLACLAILTGSLRAATLSPNPVEQAKFFEDQVLPILNTQCFSCHGGEKKMKGGLNLTTREGLLQGGDTGPAINLEKLDKSLLLTAINYGNDDLQMPPKAKLKDAQIETLTRWVAMGAPWSTKAGGIAIHHGPPPVDDAARQFWSFKPVSRPTPAPVKNPAWVHSPIDAFILAKLEAADLSPAPDADKASLLRRLYYDLIGLPPTPEQVDAFLADKSPNAYEAVVDRLLNSPQYGEHWGRHWLDLVRYAETNSFERDSAKPNAWRYRDYVIDSFNADKPYDWFIKEQIAGDELEPGTSEGIIATGYYRLGIWDDEPADREQARYDELDDIVTVTGQVFLGLTVNCARCHDHKLDPFPQKDYYRLLSFFQGIRGYSPGPASQQPIIVGDAHATPEERAKQQAALEAHIKQTADIKRQLKEIEHKAEPFLVGVERDDFKHEVNRLEILRKHEKELSIEVVDQYDRLTSQRLVIERSRPSGPAEALCITENGPKAPDTFVLLRGSPHNPGDKVEPAFPSVLTTKVPVIPTPVRNAPTCGRRKVLAEWLASPENPLTARVIANRIWQFHFGRGIVRSASDFGYRGTPPTHPELLDYLATQLVQGGWKLKPIHKLIVMSHAYRMSSQPNTAALAKDPENDRFWRFDLRRLTAEEVRDSVLAVSGNLNLAMGGPSIFPKIPAEVMAGQSRPGSGWGQSTPQDMARRSVYVHQKRSLPLPILVSFDAPDPDASCPVRFVTTQPGQALGMLNSAFINEQSKIFADNVTAKAGDDFKAQVRLALRRVTQREPTEAEVGRGVAFIERLRSTHHLDAPEALRAFCLLTLNLNEFVYLN